MFDKIRQVIASMFTKSSIQKALGVQVTTSETVIAETQKWFKVFQKEPPWLGEKTRPLHLAVTSVGFLASLINNELKFEVSGSQRADYINEQIQNHVLPQIDEITQLAEVGGYVVLKPYVDGRGISLEAVSSNVFKPIAFDASGRLTEGVFPQQIQRGNKVYTRLEHHKFDSGVYKVINKAYVGSEFEIGAEIDLSEIPEWKDIAPYVEIENLQQSLMPVFRMPGANNIEPGSRIPLSIFANAMEALQSIDELHSLYMWEFHSARRRMVVSEEAIETNKAYIKDDVFLALDISSDNALFKDYTPSIRETDLANGLNKELRLYEVMIGVSNGTFTFDPKSGRVTATQVISEDRTTYNTVKRIQEKEQNALNDLVYAMDVLTTLYGLAPAGRVETAITFGDSVFEDTGTEFIRRLQLVTGGYLKPVELVKWYFGVTEKKAAELMPEVSSTDPFFEGGDAG